MVIFRIHRLSFQRFHEGEAKYHQVTKEEMEERQFKSDHFLENQLVSHQSSATSSAWVESTWWRCIISPTHWIMYRYDCTTNYNIWREIKRAASPTVVIYYCLTAASWPTAKNQLETSVEKSCKIEKIRAIFRRAAVQPAPTKMWSKS